MEKRAYAGILGAGEGGERFLLAQEPGEKTASPELLIPSVREFLLNVRPEPDTRYLLVNAMGAHEYWGPNSNNDAWPEAGLCYLPKNWTGKPELDAVTVRKADWPYGLPTFYMAHAFAHHVNKDPAKKVGDVVFADWNDRMKRVELVLRVEKERAYKWNAQSFWDRMEMGEFPAVSMGSKVPWDRCSFCVDEDEFFRALASFNPAEHKHPGIAVLRWHERRIKEKGKGIRGIARTRAEYCDCMRYRAGTIDPSTGKKIFVFNDYPRFFDISLVRIGADKTAYSMISLARGETLSKIAMVSTGSSYTEARKKLQRNASSLDEVFRAPTGGHSLSEAHRAYDAFPTEIKLAMANAWNGWVETPTQEHHWKMAERSLEDEAQKKIALARKRAEIQKDVDGVVTAVTKGESDLPKELLHDLAKHPLEDSLGSLGSLGMVLRPREFMRMCLCRHGGPDMADMADELDLPMTRPGPPMGLRLLASLLPMLLPHYGERSGFHSPLSGRVTIVIAARPKTASMSPLLEASLSPDLLPKLGSLYQAYRSSLMDFLPSVQDALSGQDPEGKVAFVHEPPPEDLFTPLSYGYFQKAFLDELSR